MVAASHDSCAALQTGYIHTDITTRIGAIAKLTKVIVAPALHTTFRCDCAGMCNASRNRMGLAACHRNEACKGYRRTRRSGSTGWRIRRSIGWRVGRIISWSIGRRVGRSIRRSVCWRVGRCIGRRIGRRICWSIRRTCL